MKKKKMKIAPKLLSLLLALGLLAGLLAGCGSTTDTDKGNPGTSSGNDSFGGGSTQDDSSTDGPDSSGPVKISLWRPQFLLGTVDDSQVKEVEDAINAYISDKINVEISITEIPRSEYIDKANLAIANNEMTMLWTCNWFTTIMTDDLVRQNALYDLTDVIKGSTLYDTMPESIWQASRYDGRDYFVPCYKESAEGNDIVYATELVEKYNWDLSGVKTLRDLTPFLEDLKQDNVPYPITWQNRSVFYKFNLDFFDFITGNDSAVVVDQATDSVINVLETDQYKEWVTLMSEWAEAGYLKEDEVTKTVPATVLNEDTWGFTYWTDIPVNDSASVRYGRPMSFIPITETWATSNTTLGSCYCVTKNSTPEEAKACVDFLGLLYTDNHLADLFTFGIEGEDYRYEDGAVVSDSQSYRHEAWESASVVAVTPLQSEPENKVDLYVQFNENANVSSAAGFRFDSTDVQAEIAACNSIYEQYGYVLQNGGYPKDQIDSILEEFQTALDNAGFQKILEAASTQYEAWKASK